LHVDTSHISIIKSHFKDDLENINEINKKLVSKINEKDWNINKKDDIINLQKKYSKKIENIIMDNFLNIVFKEEDKIYFPFYFDFRGRKYYNSPIGPTQNKCLRFIYHYG
jgi:DNA-directed RNA polymerase